jgi:5-methylcytosine-specific restriction enzyme A
MPLSDLSEESVLKAIREYDKIGRNKFLAQGQFGPSRGYVLFHEGRSYESKAIAGRAHGFLPGLKTLTSKDLSGGDQTVRRRLNNLGFTVFTPKDTPGWETKPGDSLDNQELMLRFGVSNTAGMRRNAKHRHLVLVSDHTVGLYQDRWEGDVMYYTGMGKRGDQELKAQNRTVLNAPKTGEVLHLFEVFRQGEYIYAGQVELAGKPLQEQQLDVNNKLRKVWMFPLRLKKGGTIPQATPEDLAKIQARLERQAAKLPPDQLKARAKNAKGKPERRMVASEQFVRDSFVVCYVKDEANGFCDLCAQPAPFKRKGKPYLECHHVIPLAKDGEDTIDNAVALCPNCHRKIHSLNHAGDRKRLQLRITQRDAD